MYTHFCAKPDKGFLCFFVATTFEAKLKLRKDFRRKSFGLAHSNI